MDELSSGCNRLIFATFDAELRHVFKNSATLLPTAALTLASPCQIIPLFLVKCSISYKTRRKYIGFTPKFQFLLTQ